VATELEEGVRVAHPDELGVLGIVPRRDGFGNLDKGLALRDQERVRLFVEEEMKE